MNGYANLNMFESHAPGELKIHIINECLRIMVRWKIFDNEQHGNN